MKPTAKKCGAEVLWIEYALPETVETNEDLARLHPAWNMKETYRRTGVRERPIARQGESALDLSLRASKALFTNSGRKPSSVDGIIFCTQSPDYVMPPNSTLLHQRLGLKLNAAAFDITLGCSGYIYGLSLAKALIESGQMDSVLLVTADTYSKYIEPKDRACRTLFGDGAAATLLGVGERAIGPLALGTDGSGAHCFTLGRGCVDADAGPHAQPILSSSFISMDGLAVFGLVKRIVPAFVASLLENAGITKGDVDLFVFHQASKLALDYLTETIGISPDKVFCNLETRGNLVSASIPVALRDAWDNCRLTPGNIALLAGFGVGFSWGGSLFTVTPSFMKPADPEKCHDSANSDANPIPVLS